MDKLDRVDSLVKEEGLHYWLYPEGECVLMKIGRPR